MLARNQNRKQWKLTTARLWRRSTTCCCRQPDLLSCRQRAVHRQAIQTSYFSCFDVMRRGNLRNCIALPSPHLCQARNCGIFSRWFGTTPARQLDAAGGDNKLCCRLQVHAIIERLQLSYGNTSAVCDRLQILTWDN